MWRNDTWNESPHGISSLGKVEQITRSYENSSECGSVERCPAGFSWSAAVKCSFAKIETMQSQCICRTVLMAGTTSQVFSDVFFFRLLFISAQLLTLCSRFCDAPVLHPRHRTTPYKGPYDELMIPPEITSLWGCWKYSSLFIALPNAYQLRGGAAPEHPSCLVLLDGGPSIFFFFQMYRDPDHNTSSLIISNIHMSL